MKPIKLAAFIIYLLIILWLIWKNNFFGIFKDDNVKSTGFAILFLLKALAVPVFYLAYKKLYGGIEKFDAGKFYGDAIVINDYATSHPFDYLKLLLGIQDEQPGTLLFDNYLVRTMQWDNGRVKDFFYNDNRVVIRLHSLLHFIAFNSYYVHALFSCFLSFIGITYIYKAVKEFFAGKELFVLFILCFFPTLWFYTGALLKEGLVLFVLGSVLYLLKKISSGRGSWATFAELGVLVFISLCLKPYVLFFATCLFVLFFWLLHSKKIKSKSLALVAFLIVILSLFNLASILFKKKSLLSAAVKHQRVFADAAKGGIFLLDSVKFVRLEFDTSLVKKVAANDSIFTIKKNVPYIYWEHTHQQDTLFASANSDTHTKYKLVYQLPESGSNLSVDIRSENSIITGITCLYYSLFYPLFFNAKGLMQYLASLENLTILLSLIVIFAGLLQNKKDKFPVAAFITFALLLCLLIGLTTPNSGAILRYRSPAVIFLLLAALYYLPVSKNKHLPHPN